jgi:hypothetical protein
MTSDVTLPDVTMHLATPIEIFVANFFKALGGERFRGYR